MRKINNAFAAQNPDYGCFACSPKNDAGLKMEFFTNENEFWSEWKPEKHFDGWHGVVHGGIQATLMDETAEWLIFTRYGRSAVTMELTVKYKTPLSSVGGIIVIKAFEISFNRNIAEVQIQIFDSQNIICSEGKGKFYVFSEKDSKEKYNFPDQSNF